MRQLCNVQYAAEYESVSVGGDADVVRWRSELERPPPGQRRKGRPLTFISDDLERFMPEAV